MPERLHDAVLLDFANGVARITLSRSPGNALNTSMARGVREAALRVATSADSGDVRVAVIDAEGPAFSVGGDLREFAAARDRSQHVGALAQIMHEAVLTIANLPIPTVSVVQGTAAGGGVGLALAADIVLISDTASLLLAYTGVSLSPDCGVTWRLARTLPTARALDLAYTNRPVTGREAAAWGLASRAVPDDELAQTVADVVATLRSGPLDAFASTKQLLISAGDHTLAEHLADEAASIARLAGSAHGIEGVDAFLAKRPARFT